MTSLTTLLAPTLWGTGVALWAAAQRRHVHTLECVPARILVGGTRGKTTTVRLVTEALRLGGLTVCARTTGRRLEETLEGRAHPRRIEWRAAPRVARADVDEIRRWAHAAARRVTSDALVVENSGVRPEAMWAVGCHLFPPTVAVITGAASDHLDLWPHDEEQIARMHCRAVPRGVSIITADERIAHVAASMGFDVIAAVAPERTSEIPPWLKRLASLAVATAAHVDRSLSDANRHALIEYAQRLLPRPRALASGVSFLDLFDANDPQSAAAALESATLTAPHRRRVALYAHRLDRMWRLRQFQPWLESKFDVALCFDRWPDTAVTSALQEARENTLFVGLGNAVGPAEGLLRDLSELERVV